MSKMAKNPSGVRAAKKLKQKSSQQLGSPPVAAQPKGQKKPRQAQKAGADQTPDLRNVHSLDLMSDG